MLSPLDRLDAIAAQIRVLSAASKTASEQDIELALLSLSYEIERLKVEIRAATK